MKTKQSILSHLRTSFCALVILGASLTLPSAQASPPLPISGTYSLCSVIISEDQVGPNTIITYSVTDSFADAELTGIERHVIHPDGSITFQGSGILVATDSCGTVNYTWTGTSDVYTREESGQFVGTQGTGCFAGAYLTGTFHGFLNAVHEGCDVAGDNISYSGQIVFAPPLP
jgi:hypothetical protein